MMQRHFPKQICTSGSKISWLGTRVVNTRAVTSSHLRGGSWRLMLAVFYWGIIASDRYVSEAHVVIQKTDLSGSQSLDFSSLLGSGGGNHADQMLLRDHLLSSICSKNSMPS